LVYDLDGSIAELQCQWYLPRLAHLFVNVPVSRDSEGTFSLRGKLPLLSAFFKDTTCEIVGLSPHNSLNAESQAGKL